MKIAIPRASSASKEKPIRSGFNKANASKAGAKPVPNKRGRPKKKVSSNDSSCSSSYCSECSTSDDSESEELQPSTAVPRQKTTAKAKKEPPSGKKEKVREELFKNDIFVNRLNYF